MASRSQSPFERVPNEILSKVLLEVKVNSVASSLLQCILCCQTWHDMGMPILYRDVLLTDSNLEAFIRHYNAKHGPLLRSLTITLDPIRPAETDREFQQVLNYYGSQNIKALWHHLLQRLTDQIASMVKMTTFSFTVSSNTYACGFWIPMSIIATIIQSLPKACVNVEIDTRRYEELSPRYKHLCDDIRAILPRLQHLRLCLTTLCPSLVTSNYLYPISDDQHLSLEPMIAPSLKTFTVNCLPGSIFASEQAALCPPSRSGWPPGQGCFSRDSEDFATAMVKTLCLAKENLCFPSAEHISVLHKGSRASSASLYRRNILEGTTWAMPFGPIATDKTDHLFIRTPEGDEIV